MTKLEQLIQDLCPNGVKMVKLGDVANISIGEFVHKNKQTPDGKYPVYNGGTSNTGFYSEYNQTANKIIISARGANAGFVNKIDVPYWAGNSCYTIDVTDSNVNWFYVYYCLKSIETKILGKQQLGSIPAVSKKQVQELQIPLPPLAVQSEIVRILDKFTLYKSELAAELAARCKQYEHYRNQLLTFDDTVKRVKLGEVAELKAGSFVSRTELKDCSTNGFPCYGGNGIRGYVNHYSHEGSFSIIGRQGALCGCVHYATGKFYATEHAVVVKTKESVLSKYLYYVLVHANLNQYKSQGAQPGLAVSNLNQLVFSIPSLEVQERIVSILDRFDTLCHDIREGLPAEIDLRQKQYEHYRDRLLSFERE